ncbi:MAG TPA: hypothetical protein VFQ30_20650 [Ktedonobacteraceae bacterium]|nr:hypothetical protein [Ktedonobacteraceae bacterium]
MSNPRQGDRKSMAPAGHPRGNGSGRPPARGWPRQGMALLYSVGSASALLAGIVGPSPCGCLPMFP